MSGAAGSDSAASSEAPLRGIPPAPVQRRQARESEPSASSARRPGSVMGRPLSCLPIDGANGWEKNTGYYLLFCVVDKVSMVWAVWVGVLSTSVAMFTIKRTIGPYLFE